MRSRFIALLFFCFFLFSNLFAQVEIATIQRYQGIEDTKSVNAILVDEMNNKWIGTEKGLYKINSFYKKVEAISEESGTRALTITRDGQEWAGSETHEVLSSDLKKKAILELDSNSITSMAISGNWIWVGTTNGLYTVSLKDQNVANHYTADNSKLLSNQVNAVFKDQFGVLWIGTDRGLVRVGDKGWKLYEKGSKVTAITSSSEGTWVACDRQTWLIDKFNRWYPIAINRRLSQGIVRGLTTDRKGRLYIASEILVQYNPYDEVINHYDEESGYVNAEAMSIASDSLDDIWVGTADRGLFRIEFSDEVSDKLTAICNVTQEIECPGEKTGALMVRPRGGEAPISFIWKNEAVEGAEPTGLAAGTYELTVQDAAGQAVVLITTLSQPPPLKVSAVEAERISAKGVKDGKATIEVVGGTPDYSYKWSNGSTLPSAKRLDKGDHQVSITDKNGCKTVATVNIMKERAIPDLVQTKLEVGQTLTVNELFFQADSTIIEKESFPSLDEVHEFLVNNPKITIEIGGHTNSLPKDEYCDRLSTARAKNVAEYLHNKGITKQQVTYKGYGKRNPVASNRTEAGRKRNQRVEIKILTL